MVRSVVSKVMWLGRATVFMVGLAVIVGLVLGLASMALGADGDFFKIGRVNEAASISTLDKSGVGPALNLRVDSGPPLRVDSETKVAKLNADTVDGRDAPLWAVVAADGTGLRGAGFILTSSFRPNPENRPGEYIVGFDRNISNCSYTATIYRNKSGVFPEGSAIETDNQGPTDTTRIAVFTYDKAGNEAARAFHVQVIC